MALKPDRIEDPFHHDINHYMDEVAERGGVASIQTAGSGGYPGDANSVCTYAASPATRHPLGVLMCDVVNVDLSRYHLNWYREQVPVGYKVILLRKGMVTTNMLVPGITPAGGEPAYLGPSGLFAIVASGNGPQVGTFRNSKDEDGYVSVYIDI